MWGSTCVFVCVEEVTKCYCIMQGHHFVWQLSVATSCRLIYHTNMAYSADYPQVWQEWHDNCQIKYRPCIINLPLCSTESFHQARQLRNLGTRSWYQWHLLNFLRRALQFGQPSPLPGSCYHQNEEVLMLQLQIDFSLMSWNIQHMVLWDVTACSYVAI